MRFVMYQDCVSPHQVPFAREMVKRLGADNVRYVYRDKAQADRIKLGWDMSGEEPWFVHIASNPELAEDLIENAECLYTMFRDPDLIARRCAKGLKTFYDSERWFKPVSPFLPGWMKLLVPAYCKLAMRMAKLLLTQPNFYYLPIGPHAARDMRLICRLYSILHPTLNPQPPTPNFIPWGYFVSPSDTPRPSPTTNNQQPTTARALRVLYVGRLLKLKHVDTIIRAVAEANKQIVHHSSTSTLDFDLISLTLVGDGPEKSYLLKLATTLRLRLSTSTIPFISFLPPVPISEVRAIMRQHDVLVFASDASDGWGAVVSEALAEGVPVIGTYETGASAALLPETQLFHAGKYRELAAKLSALQLHLPSATQTLPTSYTPAGAAERLLSAI